MRVLFTRHLGNICEIRFIGQILCPVFLATCLDILALQIQVDGFGRFLAGEYRFDDCLRTGGDVTSGKHTRHVGSVSHRVKIDIVPFVDGNAASFGKEGQISLLADGRHNRIALDNEFRSLDFHRTAAAAGIRLAQLHACALNTGYLSVLAHHAFGGNQEFHFNAFFQRLFDLLRRSGHFGTCPAVQYENIFRPHAYGRAHRIHRDVAASDNGHPVTEVHFFAQVDFHQVINTVHHSLHVFAGDI